MKVLERKGRPAVVAVFLIAACLAVYWRVAQFDFVDFDDPAYIYANHQLKKGLTGENVAWAFTTNAVANWHPLTWLSYLLDYELFGLDAGGYHATNLLFHIANVPCSSSSSCGS